MLVVVWFVATATTVAYLAYSVYAQWGANNEYKNEGNAENLDKALGYSGSSVAAFSILVAMLAIAYVWDNQRERERD